ncbi:hypothetical protein QEN19_002129 [Hanseniaspora menglaensis]
MSILDNKKKLKDLVDGFSNSILKYKTSNKPNKFNSSSNELKKDYKKLTKLRKDLNDLEEGNGDDGDKETKQFIKQITLSVAESIREYEDVLVENGESIMETSDSTAVLSSAGSTVDTTKISKKEQRKMMKEKKNQMKMQAKLAQQEAFNNKQIMITERSAKDIVIEMPEVIPDADEENLEEPEISIDNKSENENVRVEHVPKSRRSEEKKKKQITKPTTINSPVASSHSESSSLSLQSKQEDLTEKLLSKQHKLPTVTQQSQQVEWGQLAAQRKQKEILEKEKEQQEQEAALIAAAKAASLAEHQRQQKVNLANPGVLFTKQLPQFTEITLMNTQDDLNQTKYDQGRGLEYYIENQKVSICFSNSPSENKAAVVDLGFPGGLASIMNDYLTSKANFAANSDLQVTQYNKWFDFKNYDQFNASNSDENINSFNSSGVVGGDQGIVITGRRQDKDAANDSENNSNTPNNNGGVLFCSPRKFFVRSFIEQCF